MTTGFSCLFIRKYWINIIKLRILNYYIFIMRCRSSVKTSASTLICIYSLATLFNTRYTQCNAGWVDPDTQEKYLTIQSNFAEDTREYELVSISTYCPTYHIYLFTSHVIFLQHRFSLMNLNRMVVPLKMVQILDGLLLIRMIVSSFYAYTVAYIS